MMKLARRSLSDPQRVIELKDALSARISELVAEAVDAGYSTREALVALTAAVEDQETLLERDPDPADDPD